MIADPYKVLGIDQNASDSDLKRAYRELSKKYHPDANPDDPEAAEEKFKQVQEAYRQIVEAKERGTSAYGYQSSSAGGGSYSYGGRSYGYGGSYGNGGYGEYDDPFGGFGGFGDFFSEWQRQARRSAENEPVELRAAANYINNGYYREALTALSGVKESERGARWYYLSARANRGNGNNATALEHAKRAADMEPGNIEYSSFLQQLQSGGTWYQEQSSPYGHLTFSPGWCLSLIAINAMCGFCFRPGC